MEIDICQGLLFYTIAKEAVIITYSNKDNNSTLHNKKNRFMTPYKVT